MMSQLPKRMRNMGKGKSEGVYKEGLALENKQDYKSAFSKYKACYAKFTPALCAMARLYLTKKYKSEERNLIDAEYQEAALDLLEKSSIPDIPSTQKNHTEFTQILRMLNGEMSSNELTAKAKFCRAKIRKSIIGAHTSETIGILITSASLGSLAALNEIQNIEAHVKNCMKFCLVKAIPFIKQNDNHHQVKVAILILLALKNSGKNKDDLSATSELQLSSAKSEADLIKEFDFDTLDQTISTLYLKLIDTPLDLNWMIRILKWFYDLNKCNPGLMNKCKEFLDDQLNKSKPDQDANLSYFCCLLACYMRMNTDTISSLPIMQKGFSSLPKDHHFYKTAEPIYKELLADNEHDSQLKELEEKIARTEGGKVFFEKAEALYKEWEKDRSNLKLLIDAIEQYKAAALSTHSDAMKKIKELSDAEKPIPEAILAKIEILKNALPPENNKRKHDSPFVIPKGKKKETYFTELEGKARDSYETQLNTGHNPKIYKIVGDLRYQGKIFVKNLHYARQLYAKGVVHKDKDAFYPYAKMCFEGLGGPVDIAEAKRVLALYLANLPTESLFLRAQICYLDYLEKKDHHKEYLTDLRSCMTDLLAGIHLNHQESLLLLFVIHQFDEEMLATEALANLYHTKFDSLTLLKQVEFLGFPSDKHHYALEFYKLKHSKTIDLEELPEIPGLNNYLNMQKENKDKQFELLNILIPKYDRYIADYKATQNRPKELIGIIQELTKLKDDGNEEASFYIAKYELLINTKPLALTQKPLIKFWEETRQLLLTYYQAKGEQGKLNLISTLCYEAQRHPWDFPQCRLIREILVIMDERFKNFELKHFEKYLSDAEHDKGGYFEEYKSDDSDSDNEIAYQSATKHNTADYNRSHELAKKLTPSTLKKLDELLKQKTNDEEKYTKQVEEIKSLYSPTISQGHTATSTEQTIEEDVQTINHFSANGKLNTALEVVSAPFYCAQLRGLHFKRTLWNKSMRQTFRQLAKQKEHPLLSLPVYSAAVYHRAGIKDYLDNSSTSSLRLKLIAHYIHKQLMKLKDLPPYKPEDGTPLPKSAFEYNFDSRLEQLQQVYSNEYDLFHAFIEWDSKQPEPLFLTKSNPLVSTADILSSHAARYAYGNKPYSGHEDERLRPEYDKDGRALRPYSGVIMLTLHPLADYANGDSNHIVSMNMKGDIMIDRRIIHERECSFFSFIKENRLHFIHVAKFPSFHHENYLRIFLHSYGLSKELYVKFKQLILETKPHSFNRRLAVLLLGEHICAFQTLYLMRLALERTSKEGWVLVFRDKYGNFSLKPTYDISAIPNGDDDRNRQRRFHTKDLRAKRKTRLSKPDQEDEVASPEKQKPEDEDLNTVTTPTKKSKPTPTTPSGISTSSKLETPSLAKSPSRPQTPSSVAKTLPFFSNKRATSAPAAVPATPTAADDKSSEADIDDITSQKKARSIPSAKTSTK